MEAESVASPEVKPVRHKAKTEDVGFVGLKLGDFKAILEAAAKEENISLSDFCRDALEDAVKDYPASHAAELMTACEATKAVAQKAAKAGLEPEAIAAVHAKLGEIREVLPAPPTRPGFLFRRRRSRKRLL